ncbi:cell division protein SepF [Paractinoplanes durhamensis]|uniref:Cell division protein SepF n=1 Tax=Paractinoplanes durhamensis TaxID=113563 RepID=A0ABQ3ZCV0_9ACTN|nr:cell division protein SepF [Actinoplanes durhamensis]GIE07636.1 cell division protein SepF 2 [Actinoplanes durhamensis]
MSAFRKAGVWLGLVEEDDEREYSDHDYREPSYRTRERDRDRDRDRYSSSRYIDDEEDEADEEERAVPRARTERTRVSERLSRADLDDHDRVDSGERARVRSITRPSTSSDSATPLSYATRDNLALAPQQVHQPQPQARPVEEEQRYQITTLHPTTYREARTIGEHFRDGVPVIINLTEMDEGDARRLVDFAAGLAFGLRGTIERVTNRVFLLSPANVQVTAEDKAKIAEGGFFNQS